MSLRVWLPLNGDLHNQGLDEINIINSGAVVSTNGKIGKCYNFDGTGYMYTNTSPDLNIKSACFWLYATNTNNFVAFCDYKSGLAFGVFSSYIPVSCVVPSGQTASRTCYSKAILSLNKWNHIALVRNETTPSLIDLYINGEKQNPSTNSDTWVTGVTDKLSLGARPNGNDKLSGKLNDLRLYDHALSAKEIKEISKALVLHYPLYGNGIENINENLVDVANDYRSVEQYYYIDYSTNFVLIENTEYTLSWDATSTVEPFSISVGCGTTTFSKDIKTNPGNYNGRVSITFTPTSTQLQSGTKLFFRSPRYSSKTTFISSIENVKLEYGAIATPYIPSKTSTKYSALGFDSNVIYDCSGYGYDGTITGTFSYDSNSPRYDVCTKIDTSSSHIYTSTLNTNGYSDSYTFAWWQKRTASDSIMAWGFSNGNRLNLYQYRNNLYLNTGDGSSNPFNINGSLIMDNTWHHVAITGDGTNSKLYIDGEFKANATTYRPITGTTIYISGWANAASYSFNGGSLSDFRLYATALSADDIKELYDTGMSIDNKQNIHTYELDETYSTIGLKKTGVLNAKDIFTEDDSVGIYKSGLITANQFYER